MCCFRVLRCTKYSLPPLCAPTKKPHPKDKVFATTHAQHPPHQALRHPTILLTSLHTKTLPDRKVKPAMVEFTKHRKQAAICRAVVHCTARNSTTTAVRPSFLPFVCPACQVVHVEAWWVSQMLHVGVLCQVLHGVCVCVVVCQQAKNPHETALPPPQQF